MIDYSPSSYVLPSLNATNSILDNTNAQSPHVTQAAPAVAGAPYGITPDTTSQDFSNSYSQGVAQYAPFQDTGVQSSIGQLQGVYNNIPSAYNVSGTVAAMNQARQAALTTGQQASNTAASQYQQAQGPGQYSGAGASVLRSQALLPYMTADTQAAQSEGQYADTARQAALTTQASVANQIANLQQAYTNSLASYNSSKASFGLGYANDQTGLALQASTAATQAQLQQQQNQSQLAEQAREANLSASLNQSNQAAQAAQTATNQQIAAAQAEASYLTNPKSAPSGSWTTSPTGQITSGQSTYDAYQNYTAAKAGVAGALANLAF